ncbi:MAG: hypothetical protein IPK24_23230 [Kineosporiaceae bacterium]|nr:hypothetical protein [Kineosporiaceae bacterium]
MGLFSKKPPAALNPIIANAMIGYTREDIKHVARVQETILAQLHGGEALKVVIPCAQTSAVAAVTTQKLIYCGLLSSGIDWILPAQQLTEPEVRTARYSGGGYNMRFFVIVGFTGGPLRVPDSKHYWDAGLDIVRFELEEAQVLEQALIALAESA